MNNRLLALSLTIGLATGVNAATLSGQGATLPGLAYTGGSAATTTIKPNTTVKSIFGAHAKASNNTIVYGQTGSGAGKTALNNNTGAFAASDSPLSQTNYTAFLSSTAATSGNRVAPVQVPAIAGAVAIVFNNPDIATGITPNLTSQQIAKIFSGNITNYGSYIFWISCCSSAVSSIGSYFQQVTDIDWANSAASVARTVGQQIGNCHDWITNGWLGIAVWTNQFNKAFSGGRNTSDWCKCSTASLGTGSHYTSNCIVGQDITGSNGVRRVKVVNWVETVYSYKTCSRGVSSFSITNCTSSRIYLGHYVTIAGSRCKAESSGFSSSNCIAKQLFYREEFASWQATNSIQVVNEAERCTTA